MAEETPVALEPIDSQPPRGTFSDYYHLILGNFRLISAITLATMLLSVLYFALQPDLYTATVNILVEKGNTAPRSTQQDIIGQNQGFTRDDDYYGTQLTLLTNRKITSKVVEALNLGSETFKVDANRIRNTRILSLSITTRDPQMAAKIANKFAEFFVQDSSTESLFIGQQILKFIPNADEMAQSESMGRGVASRSDEVSTAIGRSSEALTEGAAAGAASEGFNKKEFVESFQPVMMDSVVQRLKVEKIEIEAKLNELSQRYRPQHPMIRELNERLNYVKSEITDRTKKIVTNVRAGLAGEIKVNNVKVLEEAIPPSTPSQPNRVRGVILMTIFGFVGSVWIVLAMDMLNDKVRAEKDLEMFTRVPFLGYVPLSKELTKNKKGSSRLFAKNMSLVEVAKHNDVLTDAIASVRTHILFSMPYEKSKRIMLTSAVPAEGKSTMATLLSLSLISLGRKILLVDADMRRPSLHGYLGMKNEKGLSDYLIGAIGFEEAVRAVPGSELKLITAGSKTVNPAELLASERFRELLETAGEQFDRVVIDVPPVLFIADGLVVAKNIHSGVLVCGSGMVHRRTVQTVIEKFAAVGHAFIGIVINHANYEKEGYRYRYYRNYKNYYSTNKSHEANPRTNVTGS